MASSPRIFTETFTSRRHTPELRRNALSLFIVPPRAQASRRCETQATLSGKARKLRERFGPLTPSARSGNLIAGDGMKNGLSRSEQRTVSKTQKQPLDRKNPIQVIFKPALTLFSVSSRTRLGQVCPGRADRKPHHRRNVDDCGASRSVIGDRM